MSGYDNDQTAVDQAIARQAEALKQAEEGVRQSLQNSITGLAQPDAEAQQVEPAVASVPEPGTLAQGLPTNPLELLMQTQPADRPSLSPREAVEQAQAAAESSVTSAMDQSCRSARPGRLQKLRDLLMAGGMPDET